MATLSARRGAATAQRGHTTDGKKSHGMEKLLQEFSPITLDEMTGIKLMNRTDTKFVTNQSKLIKLLELAKSEYRVQEIDGRRIAHYYTMYFDTPSCEMFAAHQTGRKARQKLRIRSYVDSGLNFLEVKTKNNHGRTKKKRMTMEEFDPIHPQRDISFHLDTDTYREYGGFLEGNLKYDPDRMTEQIENRFSRVTLVNKDKTERLTIDTGLSFHNITTGIDISLGDIVIIELKRDGLAHSPILDMLRSLRVMPMGFSKYCIGSALTNKRLKQNRLKPRLHQIERLMRQQ